MTEIEKVQAWVLEKRRMIIRVNRECLLAEEWLANQPSKMVCRTTPRLRYQQGYKHGITHSKPDSRDAHYMTGFKVARKTHQNK